MLVVCELVMILLQVLPVAHADACCHRQGEKVRTELSNPNQIQHLQVLLLRYARLSGAALPL